MSYTILSLYLHNDYGYTSCGFRNPLKTPDLLNAARPHNSFALVRRTTKESGQPILPKCECTIPGLILQHIYHNQNIRDTGAHINLDSPRWDSPVISGNEWILGIPNWSRFSVFSHTICDSIAWGRYRTWLHNHVIVCGSQTGVLWITFMGGELTRLLFGNCNPPV